MNAQLKAMTEKAVADVVQRDLAYYDREIADLQKSRDHLLALGAMAREFLQSPQGRRLPPAGATIAYNLYVWLFWQPNGEQEEDEEQPGLYLFVEKRGCGGHDETWPGDPDVKVKIDRLLARMGKG